MSSELTVNSETIQRTRESLVADLERSGHPESHAKQHFKEQRQHPSRLLVK
jgi:hypothetical protein